MKSFENHFVMLHKKEKFMDNVESNKHKMTYTEFLNIQIGPLYETNMKAYL